MIVLLSLAVALLAILVILTLLVLLQLRSMQNDTKARLAEAFDELERAELELHLFHSMQDPG